MFEAIALGLALLLLGAGYLLSRQSKALKELAESRDEMEVEEHRMFDFLHGLGEALRLDSTSGNMHRIIVRGVMKVVEAGAGGLYLLDKNGKLLVPAYFTPGCPPLIAIPEKVLTQEKDHPGAIDSFLRLSSVGIEQGIIGSSIESRDAIKADILVDHPSYEGVRHDFLQEVGVMLVPVVYAGRDLGVLYVSRQASRRGVFSSNDFDVFRAVAEQSAFALGNAVIHHEAAEKRRLDSELKNASEIQRILLPNKAPQLDDFRIHGLNIPAKVVSGDYYDYIPIDETRFGVVIADVSGKGIPASLVMAMCRSVLRASTRGVGSPAEALSKVNREIFPDIRVDMFISVAYLILDKSSNVVTLARAGHDAPMLFRKATGEVELISPPGMAVGIDSGRVFDRVTRDFELTLEPGDCMLLYTDGVNESLSPDGEEFGLDRMKDLLTVSAKKGAKGVLEAMNGALREFSGNERHQADDVTMIAIEKC